MKEHSIGYHVEGGRLSLNLAAIVDALRDEELGWHAIRADYIRNGADVERLESAFGAGDSDSREAIAGQLGTAIGKGGLQMHILLGSGKAIGALLRRNRGGGNKHFARGVSVPGARANRRHVRVD